MIVAIGINWGEVWKPVWKAVWTNTAPTPTPETGHTGHAYLRDGFARARRANIEAGRRRLALQRALDYVTNAKPAEETTRIVRQVKAGKPIETDSAAPVVMKEVSAKSLADRIIPARVDALVEAGIDLQQVIRRALQMAVEREDEEEALLLLLV